MWKCWDMKGNREALQEAICLTGLKLDPAWNVISHSALWDERSSECIVYYMNTVVHLISIMN